MWSGEYFQETTSARNNFPAQISASSNARAYAGAAKSGLTAAKRTTAAQMQRAMVTTMLPAKAFLIRGECSGTRDGVPSCEEAKRSVSKEQSRPCKELQSL